MWWKKDAPANQSGRSWVEKGNSSEGERGEIKAALQSWSLVDLFEGWWLSAGMRTNTDACHMWRRAGRRARRFVEARKTHSSEYTPSEAGTNECHSLFKFTSHVFTQLSSLSGKFPGTTFRGVSTRVLTEGEQPLWASPPGQLLELLTHLNTNKLHMWHGP